jgi:glycolate oxidase FAD binding subunit
VLLEGHPADVDAESATLGDAFAEVDGPPPLPTAGRESRRPGDLQNLTGVFMAEVGVGTVHRGEPCARPAIDPAAAELHRRVKAVFDPEGRMNPGRTVLGE